ncbi:MAG: DUF2845 domain-containing protein [Thermodesulfovibrionales bacterium]|nr:DUF2845 domain-containing protein [Thermodesulfovibrionales bacterium]
MLLICGEPFDKQVRESSTSSRRPRPPFPGPGGRSSSSTTSTTEQWYYNCGEGRFNYLVTIKNGRITEIKSEGRGTGTPKCY